jgi:clan AA aspartic protease (TIGR02281 family)
MRGFAGGLAGGAAGGGVFIGIGMVGGDIFGRLFGIPIIGFAIGLMIMLANALFRKAWIEIRYGPRETRTLTLGAEPLRIGGDAAHCQIYVKDVPPMACAYRFEHGRVVCDDRINNRNGPVAFGTPMTIGRIIVTPFGAEAREPAGAPSTALPAMARAGQSYQSVLSLRNGRDFTLTEGTRLAAKDIQGLEANDKNGWVAEVLRNPENPAIVGLKNLSRRPWSATFGNGRQVEIEPGRSLRLENGARINFGAIEGRIGSQRARNVFSRMSASFFTKRSGHNANWFSSRWLVVAGVGAVLVVALVVMISRNPPQNQNSEAHAEEIKLENSGNTYQLKATINDTVKINFTLDTGASDVLVPAEVALTLLSSGTLSENDFIGYQTYTLADGSTLPSAQFKLREMEVGSHRLTNVVASLGPVGSPPLLGQSFLSRLGSWTIDYQRQVLVVER